MVPQRSILIMIAFFAILRATLYATLEGENTLFMMTSNENLLFGTAVADRCNYCKIDDILCQVISDEQMPL